ncbi:MAG TPA: competence/damage-inducible protein A [Nannocystis exedens]|nr:competence/damage-inducible protein A [Nannocystis exedens]
MVPTAAILLIGNELLSGKIRDQNGHFLATVLRRRGIRLLEMVTVADTLEEIGDALLRLLARTPLVFTSGGVGPTHDDVTLPAIARATGRSLVRDPTMEAILRAHFGGSISPAALSMADVPEGTILRAERGWPVLRLDLGAAGADPKTRPTGIFADARIYILPGIPELCQAKIEALEAIPGELPDTGGWSLEVLHTDLDESDLTDPLNRVVADFAEVEIGSYPRWTPDRTGHLRCIVRITFETSNGPNTRAREARDALAAALGPEALIEPPPT